MAELRGQDDLVPALAEDLAERTLRPAGPAIGVRGVEKSNAGVDGRGHHRARPVHVEPSAEVVAAEPDDRNLQSRFSKRPIAHNHILWTCDGRNRPRV